MASAIDFSQLTFTDEQIRDLKELLFDSIVEAEDFGKFHTVVPGIVSGKEIGYVGEFGLVGKAGQGCDPTPDTFRLGITKKIWDPQVWEIIRDECFTDLENTMAVYAKKVGTEEADLTGTAYMMMVEEKLKTAIKKMLWRLSWFSDEDHANVSDSPAGVITDGVDVDYFNVIKSGYWKQLFAIAATDSDRRVTIAANSQSTKALQFSTLTPTLADGYLQSLVYGAAPELRQQKNKIGLVTRSILDKVEQFITGQGLQPLYENSVNGFDFGAPGLKRHGVTWFPIDVWDEIILAYFSDGTKLYRPHRAVLTTPDNLMVGVPSTEIIEHFDSFFDKRSRKNRIEARDKMDPKISIDKLTQVAF